MKISKTIRWVLTIGILGILLAVLGIMYAGKVAEQGELNASIARAQQDFDRYSTQKKELETRLNQAKSSIATLQSQFESPTASIEINNALFETADEVNVTITNLSSSLPQEAELSGTTCQVFTISLTAEGEVVDLLRFMQRLSNAFPSSDISSVGVKMLEETATEKPSITLSLKIYAYEGK